MARSCPDAGLHTRHQRVVALPVCQECKTGGATAHLARVVFIREDVEVQFREDVVDGALGLDGYTR